MTADPAGGCVAVAGCPFIWALTGIVVLNSFQMWRSQSISADKCVEGHLPHLHFSGKAA